MSLKFSHYAIIYISREASLAAHAAAKGKIEKDVIFAAHSAGQAVGSAHVATHAFGASLYAIMAVAAHTGNIDELFFQ